MNHWGNSWRVRLRQFWTSMRQTRWFARSPVSQRAQYSQKGIPMRLFGDGVAVTALGKTWGRSMLAITMSGLLATQDPLLSNLLLLLAWKKLCTEQTVRKIWRILAWSLRAAYEGCFPSTDWAGRPWEEGSQEFEDAGQPLADGFFLVPLAVSGDMEFHHEAFLLQHHNSGQPCSRCLANSSTIPWTDSRPTAAWRSEVWESEAWKNEHADSVEIFRLPTCSIEQLHYDLMHVKSLGTDQSLLGSWLQFLTSVKRVPLNDVWRRIKCCYQDR